MRYHYTLGGGYDRQIKKKVEKGTLFAVPLTVLAIVGLAAFTSNTTSGPGVGTASEGSGGNTTVTKTFNADDGQLTRSSSGSTQGTSSGSSTSTPRSTSSPSTTGGGATSAQGTVAGVQSTAPSKSTGGTTTSPSTGGSGGDSSSCPCQALQPVVAPATQTINPIVSSIPSLP